MAVTAFWYLDRNWPRAGNWGDIVAPEIIRHLTGDVADRRESGGGRLLTVGSIVGMVQQGDVVWGSGLIQPMTLRVPGGVEWCAVRGPLTRKILTAHGCAVPEVYGDPAILMPRIHPLDSIAPFYPLGVIPHYIDRAHFEGISAAVRDRVHVIDIMSGVRSVMEEVARCEVVLSSALHGLILAEALGRPVAPVSMGHRVIGGSFKFDDYFLGSGRSSVKLLDWTQPLTHETLNRAVEAARSIPPPVHDLDQLVDRFPLGVVHG